MLGDNTRYFFKILDVFDFNFKGKHYVLLRREVFLILFYKTKANICLNIWSSYLLSRRQAAEYLIALQVIICRRLEPVDLTIARNKIQTFQQLVFYCKEKTEIQKSGRLFIMYFVPGLLLYVPDQEMCGLT